MKALVVDDDRVLADVVAFTLRREGFEIILADDGAKALQRWEEERPDIVVLDVNLPRVDGFTVCQKIRAEENTPIVLLTVRGEEDDIVRGLELGADDYIVKPFSPRQLVARVNAVLRRAGTKPTSALFEVGDISFDPSQRKVVVQDIHTASLTPLENRLLEVLMINAGQVLTTAMLIDYVWGPAGGDRDMLRQLVKRLRVKLNRILPTLSISKLHLD
jgi:DNA-binding response OmpR family regulator